MLWVVLSMSSPVLAATLNVGPAQTYTNIQDAVDAAQDGDVIEVAAGEYFEAVYIDKDIVVAGPQTDAATIVGGDEAAVTVEGSGAFELRDLTLRSDVRGVDGIDCGGVLTRIQVSDVDTDEGGAGARFESCVVSVVDADFSANRSGDYGGHILALDTALTLVGGTFSEGQAYRGGALAVRDGSTLEATDTLFDANAVEIANFGQNGRGGALRIDESEGTLTGVTFTNNQTDDLSTGGAVSAVDADVSFTDCAFDNNDSGVDGGAIYAVNSDVTVTGGHLNDNRAGRSGGALFVEDGDLDLIGVDLIDNVNEGNFVFVQGSAGEGTGGAAVVLGGDITVDGGLWSGNQAQSLGGALYAEGAITATGVEFADNEVIDGNGGAVRWRNENEDATASFVEVDFHDNIASDFGGAIAANGGGELRLTDSRFTFNQATNGGAVNVSNVDDISTLRGFFCENFAGENGGAVRISDSAGTQNLWTNTVFLQNSANNGGGAYVIPRTVFRNDHFVGNDADDGGGAFAEGELVSRNTLWAHHTGDGLRVATSGNATLSHSAWWANAADDAVSGNGNAIPLDNTNVLTDPLVGFVDDGLCDDNLVPLPLSPLIDAGDPTFVDPNGTVSDIGAWGGPGAVLPIADDDNDGFLSDVDCNDNDAAVNPQAEEVCNGIDDNCDAEIDGPNATGATTQYPDLDQDGFGAGAPLLGCAQQPGVAATNDDCDDNNDGIYPGAPETCDGADQDCDGTPDDNPTEAPLWYPDSDQDGFGGGAGVAACAAPSGSIATGGDCNDTNEDIRPGADEVCNGIDDDCDGTADEDPTDALTFFADTDGDGYGDDANTKDACTTPSGFVATPGDCDDSDPKLNPAATESCEDPADLNCDGFFGATDNDQDGFPACQDCDDGDAELNPDATEVWYDGVDGNCDGEDDFDQDGDGSPALEFGGTDCDDTDAEINPEAPDFNDDDIDSNCDGASDDGGVNPINEDLKAKGSCGCQSGGVGAGWAWIAAGLLLIRRRR
jgi:uncharacterized protein (TIGR03382 family)